MASVFPPSKGTSRNTRVCRLLVDLCPCLLRDILRHDIPESQFEAKLKSKGGVLKNKLLNKSQCDLLFPAPGQYYNNDYREFDVSLLYTLIRNLCSYKVHKIGWGKEPDGKDVSISACVERIRIARNKYVGHMSRFDMDGPTFLSIWAEIKQVVVELEKILSPSEKSIKPNTSYEIEMDTLETDPLDPELEQVYRKKFEEQETALREADEKVDQVRKQMEEKSRALRDAEANTKTRISNHRKNSCYLATNAVQAITDRLTQNNIAIVAGCPGSGTSRNTRVCRLLVDLCPCLLRDILRHDIPESQFKSKLKRKEGILKNKLLNKDQCDLLFPAPGQYYNNDYSEFDSALLYILIRTFCSYNAHKRGWGSVPRTQDVSVSACVERIRIARNKYVGHMSRFNMDGPTFISIWAEIKQVVVELEKVLSPSEKSIASNTSYEIEMDKLETDSLDPELEHIYKKKMEGQENALREAEENINYVRKQVEEKSRALCDAEENVDQVRKNVLANTKSRISNHSNNSCYIVTNAVEAITDQLENKNIAIVAGSPGSGKTTTILEVMSNLFNRSDESFTPAIIDDPDHWDQVVNSSERMIIFLDDPMGKSNFDRLNFLKWEKKFANMVSCSNNGKCYIVIAIRDIVLEEINRVCRPNSLFSKRNTISISKGEFKLGDNEKNKIIMVYQTSHNRKLNDKDRYVILKSQPYYGFPQTCFLFFTNDSLFELGVSFFTRPDKTLVNEIEKLRKSDIRAKILQYYVLVYVLINKQINMLSSGACVLNAITSFANLKEVEAFEILDSIEELDDIYLISSEKTKQEFVFRHETIKEAVLISYFKVNPKLVIKSCSLEDLGELIRTDTYRIKDQEVVLKVATSEYLDIIDRYMGFDPSYVELLQCCVFNEWIGILEIIFQQDDTLVNQTDKYGMTIITYAALWKKKELVMYLYDNKANVKHVTRFGSCLHFCVLNEWNDLLDRIFMNDPTLVDHKNDYSMSLIEYAAKNVKKDIVMYLYKKNANIMNDFQTYTFLKYCVDNNWHDVLSIFLEKDQTLINVNVTIHHSLITYAASQKNIDIVKHLLQHTNKETDLSDSVYLLQIFVDNDWFDLLDTLLKDWSSLLNKENKDGISLICYAAQWDKKRMVEFLMQHGAEHNSINFLENCVENEWTDILENMINKTPSLLNVNMADDDGFTLICYAASQRVIPIIDLLLDNHADIHTSLFLNVCIDNDLTDVIYRVITKQPVLVNYTNPSGETLICYAAKQMQSEIVLLLIDQGASIEQDDLTRRHFIQLCVDNKWENVLDKLFQMYSSVVDINRAFGSTLLAYDTPEQMVMFLYAYIPRGSLSRFYIYSLFQNFVLKRRFRALELFMRDYPECSSFENACKEFERCSLPDDDVYKVFCIDQSLVDDKTASPTFRYCLEKRPQIVLRYLTNYQNVWNIHIDGESLILHAAIRKKRRIVLRLINHWTNDIDTLSYDMINLLRHCIDNNWDDVIRIMMNIDLRFKPFLKDNALAMMIHASDKGLYNITNIIFQNTMEKTDDKDSCFMLFKKLVDNGDVILISVLLQHAIKPEYLHNSKGESLLTYVASGNNKLMSMFIVEKLASENFLDTDIEPLLQKYIENDWDDILRIILPKTYKLVTNAKLGEITRYAIRNNKKELIVSLLEYEMDHKMISLITKHCIDHEWCDVLQRVLNEDKEIVNVLECDSLPVANYAARSCKSAIVEHMFLYNNINVNHFDKYGYTPLHYCASKGWTYSVEMIVTKKPSLIVRTQNGVDCIHLAAFFGRVSLVKMFKHEDQTLTKTTTYGCNAFQMALLGLRYTSLKSLVFPFREKCKSFYIDIYEKELIQFKNVDDSFNSREYEDLLSYISSKQYISKDDLHTPMDQYGNSILHYLVINDNETLVNWVLKKGTKLALVKNVTNLPSVLHIAAYLGRSNLVKIFFECGAGAICDNDSLMDAVIAGRKFAGQAVHHSPSGWINQNRIFMYDIKVKAVKYVEFQFGKNEEFDSILRESLSVGL